MTCFLRQYISLLEVLLNSQRQILLAIFREGIISVIGDIVVHDADPLLLV